MFFVLLSARHIHATLALMSSELLADVAVNAVIAGTDPVFTYRVPAHLHAFVRPGQLVWAPLRRQRVQGIVLDLYAWKEPEERVAWRDQPETHASSGLGPATQLPPPSSLLTSAAALRDLIDVADPEAFLTPAQIRLARWLSSNYRAPLYEALALMLPTGAAQQAEPTWRATALGMSSDLGSLPERERGVLYFLRQRGETSERELRQTLRGSDSELRDIYAALQERGLALRGAVLSRPRARPRLERLAHLRAAADNVEQVLAELARSPKQRAVIGLLAGRGASDEQTRSATKESEELPIKPPGTPVSEIYAATGANLATLRALEEKGLLELTTREVRRDPLAGDNIPPDVPPQLTAGQERVWRVIAGALDRAALERDAIKPAIRERETTDGYQVPDSYSHSFIKPENPAFLLHGVTGSGKTELYLRSIGRAMRHGRQALVLVPEIALTTQLVRRFAARFPGKLAVLHSGLADGERYDEWRRLRRGEAMLAIGSRSAVFAPLPHLGLIIVDEEHETSYKHDGAPRYHARDAARQLAELTGSTLILGSATPSVESYQAAQAGTLVLLELLERVGMARDHAGLPRSQALPLPPVKIVDMRRELQTGNRSIFSRPLQEALTRALERKSQAILFLNRRGVASFVMCRDCGHVVSCPNCSSPLTLHNDDFDLRDKGPETNGTRPNQDKALDPAKPQPTLLVCHTCSHRELVPLICPECWSPRIKSFGVGTQRVVEEVEALFPEARTLRWDRDSVTRKGDHARMLDRFLAHEADVLVGTQMIAKGLDLPMVSVVGVVAADTGLYLPDFRAGERAFQLMTQVAGRAGRRSTGAQVVVQTYTPDHYALRAAQEHDYHAFFEQEIAFRYQTGYPPFSRLVRFVYMSGSDERCQKEAERFAHEIRVMGATLDLGDWGLIGPAPAFFHRQRNRFRWHVLLRAVDPMPLLRILRPPPGWSVDVDPVHVL